ncbi:DHA2 family efflux MFS transporter permease subunit [Aquihabitans sp. G128]|uniref:DHA2 family efflux MFS transporter permease subunit n=1 Tax=Aquihabitans sp. G128 TaxID=2849779 RepID=UPI001C21C630|nr:DHA2 family efflux MFS transporter permease subunit [Aquihabitans sp. G128]QXC63099.1 DHA2 family efflux MFS transporter permease subunit [Aquihabitans sp. G128]
MDTKTAHERRWIGLGVLCLSLLVVGLDNTILSVAIPKLSEDLGATTSQLQWIVDGYTLVFAGLLLTTGALGDRFGRRSALSIGLGIFVAGSVASAFAGSAGMLIATRSLMGVGGALIMPATLSLLTNLFTEPKERAKAIGIWAGVSGIGVAIGPMLGGWLLEHFSWGSVFLINVPVVAIALPAGYFLLPNSKAENSPKLDPLGAVLSIVGLVSLVWAIIEAPAKGWGSTPVLGAFALGFVAMAVFIWWQMTTDHPMLDVRFFKNPRFSAANLAITLAFFAMVGSMFVITQFMQFVLGFSPLQAGLRSVPLALCLMLVAPQSSRLVEKVGTKLVVAGGLATVAAGLFVASTCTPELGYGRVLPSQLLLGIGIALAMAPATESVMGSLPKEKAGVGSAMNDTTRQVGGALGVAIIGSVFSSRYAPLIDTKLGGLGLPTQALDTARDSIGGALAIADEARKASPAAGDQIANAARDAFAASVGRGLLVSAAIALVGAIIALVFLPARAVDPQVEAVEVDESDLVTALASTPLVGGAEASLIRQDAEDDVDAGGGDHRGGSPSFDPAPVS